jgi:predicted dienelactone hydrolase
MYSMRRTLFGVLLLAAPLWAAGSATHINIAGRDVAVWKPAGAAPSAGFPVVVFSHGFGGCNTQSVFLMEALANAGYLVVAPNHADAHCGSARRSRSGGWRPEEPFQKAGNWSEATYRDRRADIEAVLDAVLQAQSFQGVRVDATRVGIAGHSLGGYTALGVAGAWASWKDPRIKAVLALSPFNTPFVAKGDLGRMNVPVMYQGGTLDFGISPTVRRMSGAYERSSPPKYYVEFRGAGHLAWTDLNPRFHSIIDRYSLAFFDRYLKGSASPAAVADLFEKQPAGVSFQRSKAN